MQDKVLAWAEDDRPREKFLLKGRKSVSDAEIIAILIGSGTLERSAVSVARELLGLAGQSLTNLSKMNCEDLCRVQGIGKAKAVSLMAAFELGRRKTGEEPGTKIKITSSAQVYAMFKEDLADLYHEEFWILLLNRANMVIQRVMISRGGLSSTIADPKVIFQSAINFKATAIVLVHNHPSGNTKPSESDMKLTQNIRKAGEFLDLPILDHIIVTSTGYFSFTDNGI